jgi:hypothetical protein
VKRYHLVYAGIARRARTLSLDDALEALASELRQAVAAGARRRVFVHAGVVGWRGRAILVPGRSGAGKTTLVAELVKQGAVYYSDEFAVLDRRGRVGPFAKPLSIKQDRAVTSTPVSALGGVSGVSPLRPLIVALSQFRAGSRWRPSRLSRGQALLSVLPHTVPVRRRPRAALGALQAALAGAVVVQSPRGEASLAAAAILRSADRELRRERHAAEQGEA